MKGVDTANDQAVSNGSDGSEMANVSPNGSKKKKSLVLAIIAILVAIILLSTVFTAMVLNQPAGKKSFLEIKLSPSTISMSNGSMELIYAYVHFKNNTDDNNPRNVSNSAECHIAIAWQNGNVSLGGLTGITTSQERYWQIAANNEGSSKINWSIDYTDPISGDRVWKNATQNVEVGSSPLLLDVTISPSKLTMPDGTMANIYAYVLLKNITDDNYTLNVTESANCSITPQWESGGVGLGTLTPKKIGNLTYWELKATDQGAEFINWSVEYFNETTNCTFKSNVSSKVSVGAAVLDYIHVSPTRIDMVKKAQATFTVKGHLTDGTEVTAVYSWSLDNMLLGALSYTSGPTTTLTAGDTVTDGKLICSGTYAGKTVYSNATITVSEKSDAETHTRIYDMFNVPLQHYWHDRYQEIVLSYTFPVAYVWLGTPAGNNLIYSDYRMNVTARNISKVNTESNPCYVPILNPTVRGGNISIDWIAGYIDGNEVNRSGYPEAIRMYYDSWFFRLNGTITMDRTAAKMVLDMTDSDFDNFNSWKASKFASFRSAWSNWLLSEMNTRVPIKYAYEWEGSVLSESYDIIKSGETVIFQIKDYLSYGMESLLGRWWRDSFASFEGWPEDVHFSANIGQMKSDFNLDMALQYSLVAKTSTQGNQTCWGWENTHADSAPGTSSNYVNGHWVNYSSEMNRYASVGYWNSYAANAYYNTIMPYDYTPWAGNLSANDTWSIEWPSSSSVKGYRNAGTGVYTNTVTGHVDPIWIEPIPGEIPSNMNIDWTARKITIDGPFNAWNWSMLSFSDRELRYNWSRTGLLPRGVPYIEFGVNSLSYTGHAPLALLWIPSFATYTHGGNHNFYADVTFVNYSIPLKSVGYDIGGSIISYHWEFGDGAFADTTIPNTTHTWTKANRNCTVNLTVTDNDGMSSTESWVISFIQLSASPVASFTSTSIGVLQVPTSFDASASYDPDGTIIIYSWEFGDGMTDFAASPTTAHQYAKMGNYQVNLTVMDNMGSQGKYSKIVAIQTEVCAKIVMPDRASVNQIVFLSSNKSFSFDGSRTIVNYSWDFGDGVYSGAKNPTHAWTSVGIYMVTLMVKDSTGKWSPETSSRINIGVDTIAGLSLSVSRHALFPGESASLKITAVDGAGKKISGSFTVDISANSTGWTGLPAVGVSLVAGEATIPISCTKVGWQNITAIIQGDSLITGSEFVTIANRTVEITIYDLGQKQLGSVADIYTWPNYTRSHWSNPTHIMYGNYPLRYGAMALNLHQTGSKIGANIDTTDRVNVEARNLSEVNMASMTFFPRLNTSAGGHVSFTWDYHYMNLSEYWWWNANPSGDPTLPQNPYTSRQYDIDNWGKPQQFSMYSNSWSSYDGLETMQTISVTMDQSAAYQLLQMPSSHFTTDPVAWWDEIDWGIYESKNMTVERLWEQGFMTNEGGSNVKAGRLDIKSCDDSYAWSMGLYGSIFFLDDNHDGTITLTINRVGYGEDALLARWLYWGGVSSGWNYPNGTPRGIMSWEPYYDDFYLSGDINSQSANITLDAANINAWRAQKSGDPNVPADTAVWRWEQTRIDYAASTHIGTNNRSEMDLWADRVGMGATFDIWDPAGAAWGTTINPDQSPNVIYLDVGESLIIERPRTVVSGILPVPFVGDATLSNDRTGSGYINWILINEKWGNATVHPIGCYPGTSIIDKGTGDLTIVGPFTPKINYYTDPGLTWLWRQSAPLIEYWIQ